MNRLRRSFIRLVSVCIVLSVGAQHVYAEGYPVSYFFKRPDIQGLTISPDGQHAAAIIPKGEQKVVAILDISDPTAVTPIRTLSPPTHQDVGQIAWVNDNRIAFATTEEQTSLTSPRFTGNFFAGDIDGSNKRQIAGAGAGDNWTFLFGVVDIAKEKKNEVVVLSVSPGDRKQKMEWLNVKTGKTRLIGWSPFVRTNQFVADHDREPRFATGNEQDDYMEQKVKYRDQKGKWEDFQHPFNGDIRILGFDENNVDAWIASDDLENFGLYKYNTQTKEFTQMLTDDYAEVQSVVWDYSGKNVIGAVFMAGYPEYKFFNERHPAAMMIRQLSSQFPGQTVTMTSISEDQTRATVFVSSDVNPGFSYLFELPKNRLVPVAPILSWVDSEVMAERRPIQVTARDGLVMNGYITLPKHKKPENLPMIVLVHGGPHGPRDVWGWDPEAQYLANQGYLVLQINFRGSGGFGKQFMEAGYRRWGTAMQDDLTDATLWAVKEGLADPDRMCIYGASYGGYAALAGITREPDLYKCAFAFVGVYDLELVFKSGAIPRSESGKAYLEMAVGTDKGDLAARSPINHVAKIKSALHVAHGKKDDQADVKHYYALTEALDKSGIPYDSLLTDKEAHGFYDLSNREELYGEMLSFFQKHIGQ